MWIKTEKVSIRFQGSAVSSVRRGIDSSGCSCIEIRYINSDLVDTISFEGAKSCISAYDLVVEGFANGVSLVDLTGYK